MAVAAESYIATAQDTYQFVDALPEVAEARTRERTNAEALLVARRNAAQSGNMDMELPLQIDALSTADAVLAARAVHGEGSEAHELRYRGLVLDCQRLVAEWYRKKKPEYFPPVRHVFDAGSQEFFSHGLSIRQMTENALTPIADNPEEEARRINERVEDATPQLLRKLGGLALGTEAIRTISECTDKAIDDYMADLQNGQPHRGYGGYVPEIEKVMIRDIRLDQSSDDRFEEQIGLPGTYITHEVIIKALERRGVPAAAMNKTELHGSQLLANDDLLDFVALLDTVASETWRTNVFMGEIVPRNYLKNYVSFRREALERQESLKDLAETVAQFVLNLAEDNVDRRRAPALVENFVKRKLLELGKQDMTVAEQMFDTQTAVSLQAVAQLEARGAFEEAFKLMQQVEEAAPGGGFCGAGSCGLEGVDVSSEAGKQLAAKVGAKSGDTVLRDKERSCKCGSKSIVYAFNKRKVNKYCESCGSYESKVSIAGK